MTIEQEFKIKVKCDNCNKEFFKRRNQIVRTKNNFCCLDCSAEFRKNKPRNTNIIKRIKSMQK